jgi:bacteriocin biosynthesis cyclodehydratase domain-containing protein
MAMSGYLASDCRDGHSRLLNSLDTRIRRMKGETAPTGPLERLQNAQIFLVAGGAAGVQAAVHIAKLGVSHLTVYPLSAQDLDRFSGPLSEVNATGWSVLSTSYNLYAAALQLRMHQVIVFAASRPFPRVQAELNEAAVRLEMPYVQASAFAHEITLGPTVLPGFTACHTCYQSRLISNYGRSDVPEARDRFLDKNPEFEFKGRINAIDRTVSSLVAMEVERLLSGSKPPLALSAEVIVNVLTQSRQDHFVPYLEWCPTCSHARPLREESVFREFVSASIARADACTEKEES